jgi:multidrug efflux system outer membrane protein
MDPGTPRTSRAPQGPARGRRAAAAVLLLAVAGCTAMPAYEAPGFAFRPGFAGARAGVPVLLQNDAWWRRFGDPVLDALAARALDGSLTLAIARERVRVAQAELAARPGAESVTPRLGLAREGRAGGRHDTALEAGLGLDWLFDPWGERRATLAAAGARAEIAAAEVDAARLGLLAALAGAYVELRHAQRLAALRGQELRAREQTRALVAELAGRGAATRLDLARAEALVAETRAALPGVQAQIEARKAEIAVLAGVAPGSLGINLDAGAAQPRPRVAPEVGIPADLLRNRPDIRIAERGYYAALADLGAARAARWPRLSLGGSITLTAARRGGGAADYSFGPALVLPGLDGSDPGARVAAREAAARAAHLAWRAAVLEAIREAETGLAGWAAAGASVRGAERTVRLYREVRELTREVVTRDGATIRDLIDAEQSVAAAEIALAGALREAALAFVRLNASLGSGSGGPAAGPAAAAPDGPAAPRAGRAP